MWHLQECPAGGACSKRSGSWSKVTKWSWESKDTLGQVGGNGVATSSLRSVQFGSGECHLRASGVGGRADCTRKEDCEVARRK